MIAVDLRVFQKIAGLASLAKNRIGEKSIILAVNFTGAR